MMSYLFDDKAKEKGEDKPLALNNDGPDALRYGWNRILKDYDL
jgi:hypothetical protein